ncbi:uncharacterized protein LOC113086211 isoform X2 [Carassius auratus]|uniref:Uncharacterized protein LOC113086211 isoform X2 n=1 Tax=Carassius auratus TaxID=7957 RepID=A0A6P6NQ83_CARAU|nr:uncharacterized protein LOC113086211 isoform X2 [Carassius auratus]
MRSLLPLFIHISSVKQEDECTKLYYTNNKASLSLSQFVYYYLVTFINALVQLAHQRGRGHMYHPSIVGATLETYRSGVFCGGSRSVLEGNQGDVVGPDGVPAVQRRSPCGCDDAGGDLTIQKLLQSQSHFTEGNAGTGSLATIGNSTKQISCLLYIWPRTSDEN